ncbi:MAG: hypothetical protein JSS62_04110 [Verrucomicrobia bacterium]|nr:hypothetical protein [Verrucomicrobiota bacterium]MBS0645494.1 hypothetical protein [Verrucomicrobiota bacterium]
MILKDVICDAEYVLTPNRELKVADVDCKSSTEELFRQEIQRALTQGEAGGEKRGYAKAHEELKHLSGLLHTIADHLMEHKKRLLVQLKPEIVEFVFQISQTVIRQELVQPESYIKKLQSLLNQAMTAFAGQALKVFLAPEDLVLLENYLERLVPPKQSEIKFLADAKVQPGDCRIEAEMGLLHAEVARELSMLKAHVLCQSFCVKS